MGLLSKKLRKAGPPLALAGVIVFLGIQTAEMNYLGQYSTKRDYISELGNNNSGASLIFNLSMIFAGILIAIASRRLSKNSYSKWLTIPLFIYGLGTLGVGLFPSVPVPTAHGICAGLLFVTGPMVAFNSRKYLVGSLKKITITLSFLSTIFLINFAIAQSSTNYVENIGGIERWVVYPITMWLIIFGSYTSHKENLPA